MNWNPEIAYWVINGLMFTIPFSWYVVLIMYKDLRKKNRIIKVQERFIDKLTNESFDKHRELLESYNTFLFNEHDEAFYTNYDVEQFLKEQDL